MSSEKLPASDLGSFPGVGDRIARRLNALGYWKNGRPDVTRFCEEKRYRPQYVYAWLRDRVPGYANLKRLARDLEAPMCWILLGRDAIAEIRELEMRHAKDSHKDRRRSLMEFT